MTHPVPPVVTITDPLHPGQVVEVLPEQERRSSLPVSLQALSLVIVLVLLAGLGTAIAQRATEQDRRNALRQVVIPPTSSHVHVLAEDDELVLEYTHFFLNTGRVQVQLRDADLGPGWRLFSAVPLALFPSRPTAVLFRRSLSCDTPEVEPPRQVTARLGVAGIGEGERTVRLTERHRRLDDEIRRSCGLGSPREAVFLTGHTTLSRGHSLTLHLSLANDGIQPVSVTGVEIDGFKVLRLQGRRLLPGRPLGPTPDDLARVRVTVLARFAGCPDVDLLTEPPRGVSGLVRIRLRGADRVEEELLTMMGEVGAAALGAATPTLCDG